MVSAVADLAPIAGKLGSLVRLLSSDRDGEVVAAARTLARTLKSYGADFHALAERVEHANGNGKLSEADMRKLFDAGFAEGIRAAEDRQHGDQDFRNIDGNLDFHRMALFCAERYDRLSDRERDSIDSVAARTVYREPTEKQSAWLKEIVFRLGGRLSR
jgi:hypothetical protein